MVSRARAKLVHSLLSRLCERARARGEIMCSPRQKLPCEEFFCEVCVLRTWSSGTPFAEDTDIDREEDEEEFSEHKNQPTLLSAAASFRANRCPREGLDAVNMPCQHLDEDMQVEDDAMAAAPEDPHTRKRGCAHRGEDESTAKTRKHNDGEPTNSDLLQYMKWIFESNKRHTQQLEQRFDHYERRMDKVEKNCEILLARIDSVELSSAPDDRITESIREIEKRMETDLAALTKKLQDDEEGADGGGGSGASAPTTNRDGAGHCGHCQRFRARDYQRPVGDNVR